ncbi:cbb3-type cytochrome oxidase assembly protein CcoS [Rhodovibrionaceae bacterium A322]
MSSLLYLIPIALFLGLAGLGAFMWALRSGQFDDLDGAAHRVLFDEEDEVAADSVADEASAGDKKTAKEQSTSDTTSS